MTSIARSLTYSAYDTKAYNISFIVFFSCQPLCRAGEGSRRTTRLEIGSHICACSWVKKCETTMEVSCSQRWENNGGVGLGLGLGDMPELCIIQILAFTTPKDICRLAAVSQLFKHAATSDPVWEAMLPFNYRDIFSKALNPIIPLPSKKELYFHLSNSILIDAGTKRVWLERSTGKICFMLSARELAITWGDDDCYWHWVSREDSRFEHVAQLRSVCWLEIGGRIECAQLSPNTAYTVAFVIKFSDRYHCWNILPVKFSVITQYGDRQESARCLVEREGGSDREGRLPRTPVRQGNDGWMEFVAGDFTVQEAGDAYVEFGMEEVEGGHWKSGLLLDGVKIEPKRA